MPGRNCGRLQGKLKGCGYRMTMGREIILDILSQTKEHLSAEEIYMQAHQKHPDIGLTSIYRTINLLTEMGIVHKLDFGDGRARFELADSHTNKQHHHHLVCTECQKVVEYSDFMEQEVDFLKKVEEGLSRKYNFSIKSHVIQFYGICGECRK